MKIIKIFVAVAVLLIGVVIWIPVVFEGKIKILVEEQINKNVDATVNFEDVDLSLLSSFPDVNTGIKNISIINNTPFKGDTLFFAKEIHVKFPFKELFNLSSGSISVSNFILNQASIHVLIHENGKANFDIAKAENIPDKSSKKEDISNGFKLALQSYEIKNTNITYRDASSKIALEIKDLNHQGSGDFSSNKIQLKTKTSTYISFVIDSIAYLNKNKLQLDAVFDLDLKQHKYSFLKNKLLVNQLPLVFDGYVQLHDKSQEVHMTFKTPSSDFKNFLGLVPKVYSKDITGVTTTGSFAIDGKVEGVIDDVNIPKFTVNINAKDASFKYPDLPQSLDEIQIKTEISNKTGLLKDTYVILDRLSFKMGEDVFGAKAKLLDITKNMQVDASLKGVVNLENLENIYPAEEVKNLKGILNMDVSTRFDMQSIEKERYQNTKTLGNLKLINFTYVSDEFKAPLKINNTEITFNPETVVLNNFDAAIGATDFKASGKVDNLLGFVFKDENVEGYFKIDSDTFSLNDFMTTTTVEPETKKEKTTPAEEEVINKEQIKVPSFLDCTIDAKANTVLYDNITLKNVTGTLLVKDEKAILKDMKSEVFGGALGFNGEVSTKTVVPTFDMNLYMDRLDISESFIALDLLKSLAPIAGVVNGLLNAKIGLSGNLRNDFTPDLNSLSGDLFGQLLSTTVTAKNAPLLQNLTNQVDFIDVSKLNLNDLKAALTFKDGNVEVQPFMLKYEDIAIQVSGKHGFDTSLDYSLVLDVPAKYLGEEATKYLKQLNDLKLDNMVIPVNVRVTGDFNKPIVKTDMDAAIKNLSQQVLASQQEKLTNEGKKQAERLLNNFLSDNQDSTATKKSSTNNDIKKAANDILGNFFGKKKGSEK